jgi:hypothetical protein
MFYLSYKILPLSEQNPIVTISNHSYHQVMSTVTPFIHTALTRTLAHLLYLSFRLEVSLPFIPLINHLPLPLLFHFLAFLYPLSLHDVRRPLLLSTLPPVLS